MEERLLRGTTKTGSGLHFDHDSRSNTGQKSTWTVKESKQYILECKDIILIWKESHYTPRKNGWIDLI